MKRLKVAFLISAKSGTGKGAKLHDRLPALLDERGLTTTDYHCQSIGTHDVVLQAADLAKEAERLIVVGGDGTAAAALVGVLAAGETVPIGVIPIGTGNDLARVTGTHRLLRKRGLKACLQGCIEGIPVPIDIWRINKNHFMVNYLSFGMDAAVVGSFCRYRQKRRIPYALSLFNFCMYGFFGLRHLFTGITGTTIVQIDDNGSRQTRQLEGLRELVISNIPSYAAGTVPSPDADFSDRYLDITAFRNIFSFAGLFFVKPLGRMRTWYGTMLSQYGGEKVRLKLSPGNCLQIDGEDKTCLLDDTDTITIEHAGQGLVVQDER